MAQPSRWGVARIARLTALFGLALLFGSARLTAQETTGKVEGTVHDQSGAPVAGATVQIVGSAFASTTNEQGYYFINNVPAGLVTVRATYIGFTPAEAQGIRVLAGQTITVSLALQQGQAIALNAITIEVVANPIVPRDQVASKPIISGDLVQNLPVNNVTDAIRLEPGVVQSARGLSIRGGRIGEAIAVVDGVPIRSVSGRTGTAGNIGVNLVGADAIEEASITTGAIGASQGDAQSGVISLVTRSGGQRFTPFLRFESDEPAGQSYGQGLNHLEASLGGPLAHNLTFFVSTLMEGRQSNLLGKGYQDAPLYVLNGVDTTVTVQTPSGDSTRVALPAFTRYSSGMYEPDAWSNDWNLDGKINYSYGAGSRISISAHRTRNQGLNFRGSGPGGGIYDPQEQTGYLNLQNALILNLSQTLSRSSEHALSLDGAFSIQSDRSTGGLVDQGWFADNHTPFANFAFGNVPFVVNFNNFTLDDRLIQNIRVNNCLTGRDPSRPDMGGCVPFINRTDDLSTSSSGFRANPYGAPAGSYVISGTGSPAVSLESENRVTGRLALDWQANRYNRVQIGGNFLRADVRTYNASMTTQIFMDAAAYKPTQMGLYAQDRVDLGDVVIDLGLRYDRLNSNVLFPRTAGRIFSDPLRGSSDTSLVNALAVAQNAIDTATAQRCHADRVAADTTAWSTCNLFAASSHGVLEPSVRVSFPVTDRTGFRLSYAQQAQTPDFRYYASSVNTDLAITNTNSTWGQDITYGKTILFEFGVRHAFTEDMVLDVSAYNKDKVSDVTGRVLPYYDPFYGITQNINLFTNQDYGNVRGIDVKLDRRIGSLFQGSVAYTFQSARSTGSDPTEYLNTYARQISAITGDREPPPQAALTTQDNRTHTIAGSLVLNLPQGWHQGTLTGSIFQGFGAFATFRFASGLAYTPEEAGTNGCVNLGEGITGPGNLFGLAGSACAPLNSRTTPWIKDVDLRLTRGFAFGSRNVTLFADIRNLFNFTNVMNLFVETGDVHNAQYEISQVGQGSSVYTNFTGEFGNPTTKTVNGTAMTGWDLSDCNAVATSAGEAQIPDCIMMRRVEARFADPGDPNGANQFLTTDELSRAYSTWYNRYSGVQTLVGPGMTMRLGFEINF